MVKTSERADLLAPSGMTDSQLVAAHLGGHPTAFGELYDRYRD
jgi:hypothetical protein